MTLHNLNLGQLVHQNAQTAPSLHIPPTLANPEVTSPGDDPASALGVTLHALNPSQLMHHCQPGPPIHTTNSTLPGPDGCNLFIFHLPNGLTNMGLYTLFATFGTVVSARIMVDNTTGRSRGFGFVSFDNRETAMSAIRSMDGFQIGHKRLKVQFKTTAKIRSRGGERGGSHHDLHPRNRGDHESSGHRHGHGHGGRHRKRKGKGRSPPRTAEEE